MTSDKEVRLMLKKVTLTLLLSLFCITTIFTLPALAKMPFSDVPEGHWAYMHVEKTAAAELVQGYPDGLFKGGQPMTRYEVAEVVSKLLSLLEADKKSAPTEQNKIITEMRTQFDEELTVLKQKANGMETRLDQHQHSLFIIDNKLVKMNTAITSLEKEVTELRAGQQAIPGKDIDPILENKLEELEKIVSQQEQTIKRLYTAVLIIAVLALVK
jgi:hypothetical protein